LASLGRLYEVLSPFPSPAGAASCAVYSFILEYELNGLQRTLDPGAIADKVLAHPGEERVSCSRPHDQTADIVVAHVDSQRNAKYYALKSVVYTLSTVVRRLDYYLSLLPNDEADVIRWFYFEGLSWAEIRKKASVSKSTAQRRKTQGFETLVRYYTLLNSLPAQPDGIRVETRFVSHLHEERYLQCLSRIEGAHRTPGLKAMMYLISGCNELWNAGADSFLSFETWEVLSEAAMEKSFSAQGARLLQLARFYALDFNPRHLPDIINNYFPGLELVHLELAIESLRIAQVFSPNG
jgi:predicted DNA-binding protein YlxM (UPF0122 family)